MPQFDPQRFERFKETGVLEAPVFNPEAFQSFKSQQEASETIPIEDKKGFWEWREEMLSRKPEDIPTFREWTRQKLSKISKAEPGEYGLEELALNLATSVVNVPFIPLEIAESLKNPETRVETVKALAKFVPEQLNNLIVSVNPAMRLTEQGRKVQIEAQKQIFEDPLMPLFAVFMLRGAPSIPKKVKTRVKQVRDYAKDIEEILDRRKRGEYVEMTPERAKVVSAIESNPELSNMIYTLVDPKFKIKGMAMEEPRAIPERIGARFDLVGKPFVPKEPIKPKIPTVLKKKGMPKTISEIKKEVRGKVSRGEPMWIPEKALEDMPATQTIWGRNVGGDYDVPHIKIGPSPVGASKLLRTDKSKPIDYDQIPSGEVRPEVRGMTFDELLARSEQEIYNFEYGRQGVRDYVYSDALPPKFEAAKFEKFKKEQIVRPEPRETFEEGMKRKARETVAKGRVVKEYSDLQETIKSNMKELETKGLTFAREKGLIESTKIVSDKLELLEKQAEQQGITLGLDIFPGLRSFFERIGKRKKLTRTEIDEAYAIMTEKELPAKVPEKVPKELPTDAVGELEQLLKKAKPKRKIIEREYTKERARRIGEVDKFIEERIGEVGGEEGYRAVLGKLKGELIKPGAKMAFEPFKKKLTDAKLKEIYMKTWKHPYLDNWEKISTIDGLARLLGGEIPQPKQLLLLEEVYGSSLVKGILSKRLWGAKARDFLVEAANIPRSLLATADMSAFLRQGIIPIVAHPFISAKAVGKTFKFAFSPKSFKQYFEKLPSDPMYPLMRKSKLAITDPSKAGMIGREEPFISHFVQRIPIIGMPVRFAERAYVGFLNKVRVDLFKSWAEELTSQGMSPVKDAHVFRAAANVVNTFTGRGNVGKFERITPELNTIFFSPRLIAARFNALNPVWYAKQPKILRKKAIGDFSKFVSVGLTTLALIKTYADSNPDLDITVEVDPRSSDFGKIRMGNTRWDIWGGFQQWARVFAQLITGQRKFTTTGEVVSLTRDVYPFTTRKEVLFRFIEGKLAPVPALVNELISGGKTWSGEDITMRNIVREKLIPMYIQDIVEAYAEGGLGRAIGVGIPAFLGVGVQTYKPRKKRRLIPKKYYP